MMPSHDTHAVKQQTHAVAITIGMAEATHEKHSQFMIKIATSIQLITSRCAWGQD